MFTLHPALEKDCFTLGTLGLSRLLLMNNALFPWVILVPEKEGLREIIDLSPAEQQALTREIDAVSRHLQKEFSAHKLNVAALGNQVPQLHIHIIARFEEDAAWPTPVWGKGSKPYGANEKEAMIKRLSSLIKTPVS